MINIILIAIGLSMDAFAVSITSGLAIKNLKINNALKIALFFGCFQAIMPAMGWLAGLSLRNFISNIDHWIAFCLLFFIGIKMIYEAVKINPDKKEVDPLSNYILFLLAIATSIDALAVGVTFAFLKISIPVPVIIIGITTFLFCFFGVFIGNKFGHVFENKIEIAGGVILIAIGIKILIEHLA